MKSKLLLEQINRILPLIIVIYLPTIFFLLLIGFISWKTNIPIMDFTRDPLSIIDAPFYLGVLSNLGILGWAAGAIVCWFSAALIYKIKGKKRNFYFLLFGGFITIILLLDDFFLLHEQVFPEYLNTSEKQVFLVYVLLVIVYLVIFRNQIVTTDFLLLGLSLICFAGSTIVDEIFVNHFRGKFLIEDGFKLLGILTWTAYFSRVSMTEIIKNLHLNADC